MSNQLGIFSEDGPQNSPLAYRVRPQEFSQFVGQDVILRRLENLDYAQIPHIVYYGPPGCGKTTLAHLISHKSQLELLTFNAVLGGVSELRKLIEQAKISYGQFQKPSIIFIDEIHRFNKAQQDALLPHLEKGDFILFGATTESPKICLNKAIISRVQTWRLTPLTAENITQILLNTTIDQEVNLPQKILNYIANHSNGDARSALNQLEVLIQNIHKIESTPVQEILKDYFDENRQYDKNSDRHYDVISAFIKSIRGSDVDSSLLWLAVMLDGNEDIEFIARRLIILASEDIGNADPRGLQIATNAHYAIKNIGMPEARIILAQATTYLANAPKSNASYRGIDAALDFVRTNPTIEVPTHLRNHHPDKKNYVYPHQYSSHWVKQKYSPTNKTFFESSGLGYEKMQQDYLGKIKK